MHITEHLLIFKNVIVFYNIHKLTAVYKLTNPQVAHSSYLF